MGDKVGRGTIKEQNVRSLQSVMNEMAKRIDTLLPEEERSALSHEQKTAEIDIYSSIDPTLAALCKEYEDIKEQHNSLLKTHGTNDPMTEISADMTESAKSAIDTRMIELKADQKIVAMALLRYQKVQEEEKLEEERKRQEYLKRQAAYWQRTKERQKRESEKTDFADVMLGTFLLYMTIKWSRSAFKFTPMRRAFIRAV